MTKTLLAFGLALAGLFALGACRRGADAPPADAPGEYLNLGADARYVGAETCAGCHREQYDTFTRSQMGRSFRQATLANSDADWQRPRPIYNPATDLYYQPFHRGQALFVREYRLAGGDTLYQRVEQIDFIVGSGHHTNSHMREENGYVYQIPVTWYAQQGRWDLAPGFHGAAGQRFSRPITEACMTCHNALPGFVEGSENRFSHVPLGIDCERCHGPGSVHVEAKKAGQLVNTSREVDYTIVNPAKLPPDRQIDVCARCHMQGTAVYADGKGPASFRPGMRLADVENVFEVREADSTARFRMAAHPDRLAMSACFEGTRAPGSAFPPMTCITCHNPHLPVEAVNYNATCQSCHAPQAAAPACTAPEVVHAGGTGNCVGCHMPASGTWDIPHVTITDHYIRVVDRAAVRPAEATADTSGARRRLVRLASLIAPAPTDRDVAEGFMGYYEEVTNRPGLLDSAAARLEKARARVPLARLAPSLIRLKFLQGDYAGVRALAPQVKAADLDAWALYRIGESFKHGQQYPRAIEYLRQAATPYHLRFRQQLASAYGDAGQPAAALAEYDAILGQDPTFEDAYNNRGFVRLQMGDLAGAEADFRAALGLNANAEMALANLASLYFNTGRAAQARPYAERLVQLVPSAPQYRQFLEAIRAAGR